jgi:DNA-directed RNA polymerase subunit F
MAHFHRFVLLIVIASLLSSCQISQQLKTHRKELERLAYGENVSMLDKFDGMATVIATALDESLSMNSPLKTYKYVNKFTAQNEESIKKLTEEINEWQGNMSQAERVKFTARSLTKPYSRKLIRVVPKVEQTLSEGDYKLGPLEKAIVLFKLKKMIGK